MTVHAPLPQHTQTAAKRGVWEVIKDYMMTTDHKKIGLLYIIVSVLGFCLGGLLALAIRVQLALPEQTLLVGTAYNQVLTMHAAIMLFFFLIPLGLFGFGNYFLPLQLGVRDVALPRLNTFAVWLFIASLILVVLGLFNGGAPSVGWTFYYPLTMDGNQTGVSVFMVAVILNGLGSLLGSANFAATIVNLRAPGMGLWKMPIFAWSLFATSILQLLTLGGLTAAALLTYLEIKLGLSMFNPGIGGVPVLYQQFFWFYSHPAVYVMLLPYLGIGAEVASTMARKPLFGYRVMVYSILAIVLVSCIVWLHHMFAVGVPEAWQIAFMISTLIVAVPTGVKIFNLIGTLWGGRILMRMPTYWLIGFIFNFLIGGITGVSLGMIPFDYQVTMSYYVVAHFHNVMMFGTAFLAMAGLYYWWPKMTGRFMDEKVGLAHFWLFMVGSWLTFLPQYILGLLGMPRRYYTYPSGNWAWTELNFASTVGAFLLLLGGLVMLWNMFQSFKRPITAGPNPWGGFTLEWTSSSPPAAYNFAHDFPQNFPTERPLYDWEKNGDTLTPVDPKSIHLPQDSIWPFMTAFALLLMGYGLSFGWFTNYDPAVGLKPFADASLSFKIATAVLYLSFPVFFYSLFKWAGTREYAVPVAHHHLTKYDNGFMGMAWFIISEVSLFAILIAGYVYLRVIGAAEPPALRPNIWLAALNTLILVTSSGVIHKAEQDLHHGRASWGRLGLFITLLLGAIFMIFQVYEFALFGTESDWRQNLWQSCFFIIVGLHGLHILIGGTGIALPYYQALTGKMDKYNHGSIVPASLYWHLVDVVWLLIVAIFYAW
ncbi:cbb3-type cytochrome c oxidase subunit I [Deinococcus wulumuqiensis]|uniref:cytochrome-c oxidase n=1 Tax=Deinococcus wulumuqiensis TaxID=980427 RepID=A0AAV4K3W8_9DEIO|nr:cbb3-type cytochrome c oxidase subunit I [Deinococcus wulumuqiensis]QII21326.1 cytochrome C oxidase subunit III [Deinococcus wulumuqiensis R12]GGI78676.1 cytochrome c oxidase subunit III [Deinococcus wulumuqiensis]GGP30259.1 cytochrome c oxidase subunit III [Deinococcus wulumuqiensis]